MLQHQISTFYPPLSSVLSNSAAYITHNANQPQTILLKIQSCYARGDKKICELTLMSGICEVPT